MCLSPTKSFFAWFAFLSIVILGGDSAHAKEPVSKPALKSVSGSPKRTPGPSRNAAAIFAAGVSRYNQYRSCISLMNSCLRVEDKPEYHHLLGAAYMHSKKFREAERELAKASEMAPVNETYANDYKQALVMGEFCSNYFADGVNRPRQPEQLSCDDIHQVIQAYEMALSKKEDAETSLNLGIAYQSVGKLSESLFCYEKALQINPDLWAGHYFAGTVYEGMKRTEKAEKQYELYLQKDSKGEYADECKKRLNVLRHQPL